MNGKSLLAILKNNTGMAYNNCHSLGQPQKKQGQTADGDKINSRIKKGKRQKFGFFAPPPPSVLAFCPRTRGGGVET